jgi:hypothetical protein
MAKAFDTVRHDFMTKVYQFYGLGPNMIKAMCTITTNRSAAIILDDGSTATPFRLGSGFPQGSPPSPNEFNICEQILILKLDLDPTIKKIKPISHLFRPTMPVLGPVPVPVLGPPVPVLGPDPDPVPVPVPVPVPALAEIVNPNRVYGSSECNGETGVVEAFADDTTPMAKLEESAILSIKHTLDSFAKISGLKCNVEKSNIMITGTREILEYCTLLRAVLVCQRN